MRAFISIACLMLVGFGCTEAHKKASSGSEKLYFAVELRKEGKLVGKPKLLGESGKRLRAERRRPGSDAADYVLMLTPVRRGPVYQVDLEVVVPEAEARSELSLLHGEVRKLELGRKPGDLAVTLTLMEVDSPEFRAMMRLLDDAAYPSSI